MKTVRATLHMALAAYLATDPDKQVVKIAKKVSRTTPSKRTKRTMVHVINSPRPAELVKRVYDETFG